MVGRIDTVFDVESFPNFFSVIFKQGADVYEYIIFEERNDLLELVKFIKKQGICLVSFNGVHYDNVILNYLITYVEPLSTLDGYKLAANINKLSVAIINYDEEEKRMQKIIKDLRYMKHFKFIDVLEVIREGYNVKSLKSVAVNMKWHRIQDLPYPYDHHVLPEQVEGIMEYNLNDVLITEKVFNTISERVRMREVFSEKYGVDVLSDADSQIAKTTFDYFYSQRSGLESRDFKYLRTYRDELRMGDLLFDWVVFQTPEMQEYMEVFKNLVITDIGEKGRCEIPSLSLGGLDYTVALGGIHTVDGPGIFEADEDTLLWDQDVTSQYPNCILNNDVCPEHLDKEVFLPVLQSIVDERTANKKLGKTDAFAKILADGLKISANTVYGLFNYKGFWLYDPRCTYQVTINNQMSILMLAEQYYLAGIEIISANTRQPLVF